MMGIFVQLNEDSPFAKSNPLDYVIQENGCWEWVGSKSRGYGSMNWRGRSGVRAHRITYEIAKGPIPAGLCLDHLCRNTSCVNPDHLEAVTHRENVLRGAGTPARHAKQTHCREGHEFTPENTYRFPTGQRRCRTCTRHKANIRERGTRSLTRSKL